MAVNQELRKQVLEVVNNQLKSNTPPETKLTYERLIALGYSNQEARDLIGKCVLDELYDVMKELKPFNLERFVRNLNKLPAGPG